MQNIQVTISWKLLWGWVWIAVITRLRIKQIFKWKFLLNNGLSIYYFNEGLLPNLLWKTSFFSYRKSNIFLRVHVSIINTKCQAQVILRFHKNEKKNRTTLNFIVKNLVLFNVVFSYKKIIISATQITRNGCLHSLLLESKFLIGFLVSYLCLLQWERQIFFRILSMLFWSFRR